MDFLVLGLDIWLEFLFDFTKILEGDISGWSLEVSAGVLTVSPDQTLALGTGVRPPGLHPDRVFRAAHGTRARGAE